MFLSTAVATEKSIAASWPRRSSASSSIGSDDSRDSLAYKLRKILTLKARETLCTDPYVPDDRFLPLDEVLKRADLLIIASPHPQYADLETDLPLIDMWGLTGQGVLV